MDALKAGCGSRGGKIFIDANTLLADSFRLGRKIWDDGFVPDYIVALWRGGTPVGIAIHEFFRHKGMDPYHTAIKTQGYDAMRRRGKVEVKGIEHVIDIVNAGDRMLIVDDVFDTGLTIREVIKTIKEKARRNCPEIRVAAVYYKPRKNRTKMTPDYYLHKVDKWLVFPHELDGLSGEEIDGKGGNIHRIVFSKAGRR